MDNRFLDVGRLLEEYFLALYASDVALLNDVFHPEAVYACPRDGALTYISMPEYFAILAKRPSPASSVPIDSEVHAIEFAGPDAAFARVSCTLYPKRFTDFLTVIRVDGKWRILTKVFHYDLLDQKT